MRPSRSSASPSPAARPVEFDYLNSRGELERRKVDALRVESVDTDWYLRGWCHLREAIRTFRLDRISHPALTEEAMRFGADDVALPDSLFEGSADDLIVTIDVASSAAPLLADYVPDGAKTTEIGDRIRTSVRVSHYHGLKRLIASMPGVADGGRARRGARRRRAVGGRRCRTV